jgi:EAL domain-containing protein (putative c-di-GMP-specific phosphodiesterase class I)
MVKDTTVDPGCLCFEITETSAIRDFSSASGFLRKLQGMGCLIALDDFGSGLSSFNYLKQLPVDYLKIDGSFIRDLKHGSRDYTFVKAIHEVSQAIGIKTIAEWVETKEVMDSLLEIGIDFAQGYYIGKPAPIQPEQTSEEIYLNRVSQE